MISADSINGSVFRESGSVAGSSPACRSCPATQGGAEADDVMRHRNRDASVVAERVDAWHVPKGLHWQDLFLKGSKSCKVQILAHRFAQQTGRSAAYGARIGLQCRRDPYDGHPGGISKKRH